MGFTEPEPRFEMADPVAWPSPDAREVLAAAGWSEQRNTSAQVEAWARALAPGFVMFAAARDALRRFGGIRIRARGPGEECARESIELDPVLAWGEEDRFAPFAEFLGTRLYPLGEAGNGHVFLAVAEDGRVYALMEDLWLVGESVGEALDVLIRGRKRRMLTSYGLLHP